MKTAKDALAGAAIVVRDQKQIMRAPFSGGDVMAMALLASTPLWAAMPDALLRSLCRLLSWVLPREWHQDTDAATIEELGGFSAAEVRVILRRQLEFRMLSLGMFLKDLVWKRGYEIEVEGAGRVEAALANGRGAVLWLADFVFGSDVARQGLYRIGHPTGHMSRPEHGFSQSAFGVRYLNPIRVRAEDVYVDERIVFQRDRPAAALSIMSDRLRKNGLVSILACAYEGRSVAETDLFHGKLKLATGGPRLAFKERCPILPVFIAPAPEPPYFTVTIGEPLRMTSAAKDVAILEAVKDFVEQLKPRIEAAPHLWRGWSSLVAKDSATPALKCPARAAAAPINSNLGMAARARFEGGLVPYP
ncbi:hypothetical protein BH10PSE7_BH10PSE7_40330 [soil metagenome]